MYEWMEVAWISLGSPLRVVMNESTISSKGRLNSRSIYCALLRDLLGDWGNYLSADRCELLRHWHFCFNMNTVQQMLPKEATEKNGVGTLFNAVVLANSDKAMLRLETLGTCGHPSPIHTRDPISPNLTKDPPCHGARVVKHLSHCADRREGLGWALVVNPSLPGNHELVCFPIFGGERCMRHVPSRRSWRESDDFPLLSLRSLSAQRVPPILGKLCSFLLLSPSTDISSSPNSGGNVCFMLFTLIAEYIKYIDFAQCLNKPAREPFPTGREILLSRIRMGVALAFQPPPALIKIVRGIGAPGFVQRGTLGALIYIEGYGRRCCDGLGSLKNHRVQKRFMTALQVAQSCSYYMSCDTCKQPVIIQIYLHYRVFFSVLCPLSLTSVNTTLIKPSNPYTTPSNPHTTPSYHPYTTTITIVPPLHNHITLTT
ncbi:hypothetical protein VP01_1024g2 [Puccinia sorghi]|uniref:Uncharacterized protein n=1 Tax=Puccinia sorghi TaxID=27349 RepID=A0A0L6VUT2_9BASI|nr:hypothetical protein VP01_1024g2 [Puccinia sorghi]